MQRPLSGRRSATWTLLLTCLRSNFWWSGGSRKALVSFASISKECRCLP